MASSTPPPYPSDPEDLRKEIEFRDKRRATQHSEVDHYTKRWRDRAADSGKAAVVFAQDSIRTGQLLNGGGLLAIPAIVTLFGLDARAGLDGLMATGKAFAFGLICAWLASVTAFFAADLKSGAEWEWANGEEAQVRHYHFRNPSDPLRSAAAEAHDKKAALEWKVFTFLRWVAVGLAFASVVWFVVGAWHGAETIVNAPQRASAPHQPVAPTPATIGGEATEPSGPAGLAPSTSPVPAGPEGSRTNERVSPPVPAD